jgi:hypothetical protein
VLRSARSDAGRRQRDGRQSPTSRKSSEKRGPSPELSCCFPLAWDRLNDVPTRLGLARLKEGGRGSRHSDRYPDFQGGYRAERPDPAPARALFSGREGAIQSHGLESAISARSGPSTTRSRKCRNRSDERAAAAHGSDGRGDREARRQSREDEGIVAAGDSRAAKPRPLDVHPPR